MEKRKRNYTLDIIRIFSFLCVVSIHFFLNSGFYKLKVEGKSMAIMCMFRSFFIIAVPMFITLTGYLMNKKEISSKYYKGIVKTLIIYFLCAIIFWSFSKYYLNQNVTISLFIKKVLAYSGTRYSWYIEMYIGLFCLIPFLNLIFNNLKDEKQARYLLLTLIFVIGLPQIINIFKFNSLEWWKNPSRSSQYVKILPSWWKGIYPIFYYFLGAYLSKYKIKLKTIINFVLLVVFVVLDGLFNFYRSHHIKYIRGIWNDYSSLSIMIMTFLVFNLLLKVKISDKSMWRNKCLKLLSDACLGAYLISCIFDTLYYKVLSTHVGNIKDRFMYAPLIIIAVFVSSVVISMLINGVYWFINKYIIEKFVIWKSDLKSNFKKKK